MADVVGSGSTLTFSGLTGNIVSIGGWNLSRESIDTTTCATTTSRTHVPSSLYDGGEVSLTIRHDTQSPPISATATTLSIQFGSSETWSASAFLTGYSVGVDGEDGLVEADATFKVTGDVTF